MDFLRALLGIAVFVALAWLVSWDRLRFQWRVVVGGVLLQILIAFVVLETTIGTKFFDAVASFITKLVSMTVPGAQAVFGSLADPSTSKTSSE